MGTKEIIYRCVIAGLAAGFFTSMLMHIIDIIKGR